MVTLWDFIHEMGLNDMTCTGGGGGGRNSVQRNSDRKAPITSR